MPPSGPDPAGPARLTRSADYARVQGSGRRVQTRHLLLLAAPGAGPPSRVGLTVSRKVGKAVIRNRVKRWLREVVREVGAPEGGPWDLVLIPRRDAAVAGFHVLRAEVGDLFTSLAR